jgi:hypothetical protein
MFDCPAAFGDPRCLLAHSNLNDARRFGASFFGVFCKSCRWDHGAHWSATVIDVSVFGGFD